MPVEVIKTIKYDELRKLKDVQIPERPDMAVYQRVDNLRRYIGRFNVNYSRNWQIFKHHYIPVVDHIFIDPNGYQVYVPDLTENGSILLGKAVKERIDRGLAISSNHLEIFKTTIEKNLPKIFNKALDLSILASEQKVLLPWDDPFDIVIDPTLEWSIICLDLETGGYKEEIDPKTLNDENKKKLKQPISKVNVNSTLMFIETLKYIKNKI